MSHNYLSYTFFIFEILFNRRTLNMYFKNIIFFKNSRSVDHLISINMFYKISTERFETELFLSTYTITLSF